MRTGKKKKHFQPNRSLSRTEQIQSWNQATSQNLNTRHAGSMAAASLNRFLHWLGWHLMPIMNRQNQIRQLPSGTELPPSPPLHSNWLVQAQSHGTYLSAGTRTVASVTVNTGKHTVAGSWLSRWLNTVSGFFFTGFNRFTLSNCTFICTVFTGSTKKKKMKCMIWYSQ